MCLRATPPEKGRKKTMQLFLTKNTNTVNHAILCLSANQFRICATHAVLRGITVERILLHPPCMFPLGEVACLGGKEG